MLKKEEIEKIFLEIKDEEVKSDLPAMGRICLETEVRGAKKSDLPAMTDIARRVFTKYDAKIAEMQMSNYFRNPKRYDVWETADIVKNRVLISQRLYAADRRRKLLGFSGIERPNTEGDSEGTFWVSWMAVDPYYQRRGIGTKMLKEIIREVKEVQGTSLNVKTDSSLKSASNLYEKLGFRMVGKIPKYFERKKDLIIYSLDLETVNLEALKI